MLVDSIPLEISPKICRSRLGSGSIDAIEILRCYTKFINSKATLDKSRCDGCAEGKFCALGARSNHTHEYTLASEA